MNNRQIAQEEQIISSAINDIKNAITQSQSHALKIISGEQLSLYYGVGLYVSKKTRAAQWGSNAIQKISEGLKKELPGLRGFSTDNIKKMRLFAEFWEPYLSNRLTVSTDLISIDYFSMQKWIPNNAEINREEFLSISFSHHIAILAQTKQLDEILFYINQTVCHSWDVRKLRTILKSDIYKAGNNQAINNFTKTISPTNQAIKAIKMFKDEYCLDFINVEDLSNEYEDVDERVVEKEIVRNIKKFIMTFGHDFAFVGNQYHLEMYGEDFYTDLLFFNRELNCLVVIELKMGKFKNAYLGQMFGYLQILDDKVKKPHENPSIGIILCQDANQSYAQYAIRDYSKPMGVVTYKTLDDMPEYLRNSLPDIDQMRQLLE